MNLILLGAPGAGKGTQAEKISDYLSIPQISTGNIIREALRAETEMGLSAKKYIDEGGLVPDEIIIGIIKERLTQDDCQNGFILDGVPRTIAQAEALETMDVRIDRVVDIEVADERIINRLSGRRVCGSCGSSYHINDNPSKVEGKCDRCDGDLVIRKDDKAETIIERLRVYHELTEPLKDFYEKAGKLFIVEGQEKVEDTTRLTRQAVEA